jgi:uncharacterized protein (DUF58 family)
MAYRGGAAMSKLEYGSVLAASLAYLMHRQRDATGLIEFDERSPRALPASGAPGHLHSTPAGARRDRAGHAVERRRPLHQLADALGKRSLVGVISDLLDDPDSVSKGLKHLRFRGTDVIVFQVLDPNEIQFPFSGAARFTDVESADESHGGPGPCARRLPRSDGGAARPLRDASCGAGIDFLTLDTSKPLDFALLAYLDARSRRK